AVEGEGQVHAVLGQANRGAGHQRDALVRRAEQHVAGHARGADRARVIAAPLAKRGPIDEQAGVEEVGRVAPGLGHECDEAQHTLTAGEGDEIPAKIHGSLGCLAAKTGSRSCYASSPSTSTASARPAARACSTGCPPRTPISSACRNSRPRPATSTTPCARPPA